MIHVIRQILTNNEIEHVMSIVQRSTFVDGKITNQASNIKNNQQIPQNDPTNAEPGKIVRDALFRHPKIRALAFPKNMARPTISRYEPGMYYGAHVDEALFPSTPAPMRSDLSCTVFLSDPNSYEGGELIIESGSKQLRIKEAVGDAVLYPSTTIHQVAPVANGTRYVAITWLQSYIASAAQRELLQQINELNERQAKLMDDRSRVLLESIRTNLFRMWSSV